MPHQPDAPIVLAFADLVNSTALLAQLGDARNDEIRRDVFTVLRAGVARFHGTEIKTQGDGIMVTFGFAADALDCAADWHRSLALLAARPPGLPLALRVGIAAGDAIFDEAEDDWFGTAVVEAARLCALAPTAGTLVTPAVHDLDADRREYDDFGEQVLKGFPDPVRLWLVDPTDTGTPTGPMPLPGLDIASAPPLVGRTDPLGRLGARLADEVGGPGIVRVTGDPGVGASRLVAEALAPRWADRSCHVVAARATPNRPPLHPVLDAIRWWVATATDDDCRRFVTDLAPLSPWLPLARLRLDELGATPPPVPEPRPPLEPDVVERFLVALARDRPLVFVVDDADVADSAVTSLVMGLVSTSHPVTVVLAHRPPHESAPLGTLLTKLQGHPAMDEITLEPLDPAASNRLIDAELERRGRPTSTFDSDTLAAVHQATGGRPERILACSTHLATLDGDVAGAVRLTQPYKGLMSFDGADRGLFFGRVELADRCLELFADRGLLVLVGNSGSGKSSLLHAGILPKLPASDDPSKVTELRIDHQTRDRIADSSQGPTLWVIDQFEELFTTIPGHTDRVAIVDALVDRIDHGDRCILALRGDFYGHLATIPPLVTIVEGASLLVGPPSTDDLRLIVEGPARLAGVELEPGLTETIVGDIGTQPGALPLLSHALYETWNRQRDRTLTVASYEASGGAEGSIAASAERVYLRQLDGEGQRLARRLFRSLVEPSETGPDTRRRMSTDELTEFRATPGSDDLVDKLVAARLVTVDRHGVDVAHEALISAWPRLRGWIDDERDELLLERRIADQAALWARGGRQDADLLRSGRLADALGWQAATTVPVPATTREYLEASVQAREDRAAETARQLATQRKANRRLRLLLVTAGVLLVGVGVLIAITRAERDRATDLATTATARALAEQASGLADTDPSLARLLAVEARARSESPATRSALFASLLGEARRTWTVPAPVGGTSLVGATGDRVTTVAGSTVSVTDPATGQVRVFELSGPGVDLAFRELSHDGSRLATVDPATPAVVTLTGIGPDGVDEQGRVRVDGTVNGVAFSPDGRFLGVQTPEHLTIFDAATREPLGPALPATGVWSVDPEGGHVAVAPASHYVGDASASAAGSGPSEVSLYSTTSARLDRRIALDQPATGLALGATSLVVTVDDQSSARITGRVEVIDRSTGAVTVRSTGDTDAYDLGDGAVALIEPGLVTVWHPGRTDRSAVSFQTSEHPTAVWSAGDRLVTRGPTSVSAYVLSTPAPLVAGPTGPANVGTIVVDPRGDWVALTDYGVVESADGAVTAVAADARTWVVDARTIGAASPRVLGPLDGSAERFDGSSLVVDGTRYTLPGLRRSGPVTSGSAQGRPTTTSADGSTGFFAAGDGGVVVDLATGRRRSRSLDLPAAAAASLALSPDGDEFGWFDPSSATAVVQQTSSGRTLKRIEVNPTTSALAIGADGDQIAVGGSDGRASVYGVDGRLRWTTQPDPGNPVLALSWNRRGDLLAVSSADQTTTLYQATDGTPLGGALPMVGTAPAHFLGDTPTLVVPTLAGLVRVDLDDSTWQQTACASQQRTLTRTEWRTYLPGTRYRPIC